ncbi:MAG: hypothetical protein ACO3RY_08890 [Opitutales bacterium]
MKGKAPYRGERLLGIAALAALATFAAALRLLFTVFIATAFAAALGFFAATFATAVVIMSATTRREEE